MTVIFEQVLRTRATIIAVFWLVSAVLDFVVVACNPQRIAALRRLVQNNGYCAIIAALIIAQVLNEKTSLPALLSR